MRSMPSSQNYAKNQRGSASVSSQTRKIILDLLRAGADVPVLVEDLVVVVTRRIKPEHAVRQYLKLNKGCAANVHTLVAKSNRSLVVRAINQLAWNCKIARVKLDGMPAVRLRQRNAKDTAT